MEENCRYREDDDTYVFKEMNILSLIVGITGIGLCLFFGYTWIVSHLNYDVPSIDDDSEELLEGELL